jgi:hypothetical protein
MARGLHDLLQMNSKHRQSELGDDTLYVRLGGRQVLKCIVGDWIEPMNNDLAHCQPAGQHDDWRRESQRAVVAYLHVMTGGAGNCSIDQQQVAQRVMHLTSDLWHQSAAHLMYALERNGASSKLSGELISRLSGLREQILLDSQ